MKSRVIYHIRNCWCNYLDFIISASHWKKSYYVENVKCFWSQTIINTHIWPKKRPLQIWCLMFVIYCIHFYDSVTVVLVLLLHVSASVSVSVVYCACMLFRKNMAQCFFLIIYSNIVITLWDLGSNISRIIFHIIQQL